VTKDQLVLEFGMIDLRHPLEKERSVFVLCVDDRVGFFEISINRSDFEEKA